ncbi:hypothetical protein CCUS01_09113 [Colletotrichum cuscutae]|uniref:Uncharacterized protein n=1 Tax=Colletotrichum cuscutae TaxID=1209917 RepID=A0AAI9XSL0_9PEZI|nr:hypothetical protein CCUS01_09113 [Colletotrichum cuscutae]
MTHHTHTYNPLAKFRQVNRLGLSVHHEQPATPADCGISPSPSRYERDLRPRDMRPRIKFRPSLKASLPSLAIFSRTAATFFFATGVIACQVNLCGCIGAMDKRIMVDHKKRPYSISKGRGSQRRYYLCPGQQIAAFPDQGSPQNVLAPSDTIHVTPPGVLEECHGHLVRMTHGPYQGVGVNCPRNKPQIRSRLTEETRQLFDTELHTKRIFFLGLNLLLLVDKPEKTPPSGFEVVEGCDTKLTLRSAPSDGFLWVHCLAYAHTLPRRRGMNMHTVTSSGGFIPASESVSSVIFRRCRPYCKCISILDVLTSFSYRLLLMTHPRTPTGSAQDDDEGSSLSYQGKIRADMNSSHLSCSSTPRVIYQTVRLVITDTGSTVYLHGGQQRNCGQPAFANIRAGKREEGSRTPFPSERGAPTAPKPPDPHGLMSSRRVALQEFQLDKFLVTCWHSSPLALNNRSRDGREHGSFNLPGIEAVLGIFSATTPPWLIRLGAAKDTHGMTLMEGYIDSQFHIRMIHTPTRPRMVVWVESTFRRISCKPVAVFHTDDTTLLSEFPHSISALRTACMYGSVMSCKAPELMRHRQFGSTRTEDELSSFPSWIVSNGFWTLSTSGKNQDKEKSVPHGGNQGQTLAQLYEVLLKSLAGSWNPWTSMTYGCDLFQPSFLPLSLVVTPGREFFSRLDPTIDSDSSVHIEALFRRERVTQHGSGTFFQAVFSPSSTVLEADWRSSRCDSGVLLFPNSTLHAISSPVRLLRCTQDHHQPFPLSPPAPQPRVVLTMITGECLPDSSCYTGRYSSSEDGFEGYSGLPRGTSLVLELIQTPTLTRVARVLRHGCTLCLHGTGVVGYWEAVYFDENRCKYVFRVKVGLGPWKASHEGKQYPASVMANTGCPSSKGSPLIQYIPHFEGNAEAREIKCGTFHVVAMRLSDRRGAALDTESRIDRRRTASRFEEATVVGDVLGGRRSGSGSVGYAVCGSSCTIRCGYPFPLRSFHTDLSSKWFRSCIPFRGDVLQDPDSSDIPALELFPVPSGHLSRDISKRYTRIGRATIGNGEHASEAHVSGETQKLDHEHKAGHTIVFREKLYDTASPYQKPAHRDGGGGRGAPGGAKSWLSHHPSPSATSDGKEGRGKRQAGRQKRAASKPERNEQPTHHPRVIQPLLTDVSSPLEHLPPSIGYAMGSHRYGGGLFDVVIINLNVVVGLFGWFDWILHLAFYGLLVLNEIRRMLHPRPLPPVSLTCNGSRIGGGKESRSIQVKLIPHDILHDPGASQLCKVEERNETSQLTCRNRDSGDEYSFIREQRKQRTFIVPRHTGKSGDIHWKGNLVQTGLVNHLISSKERGTKTEVNHHPASSCIRPALTTIHHNRNQQAHIYPLKSIPVGDGSWSTINMHAPMPTRRQAYRVSEFDHTVAISVRVRAASSVSLDQSVNISQDAVCDTYDSISIASVGTPKAPTDTHRFRPRDDLKIFDHEERERAMSICYCYSRTGQESSQNNEKKLQTIKSSWKTNTDLLPTNHQTRYFTHDNHCIRMPHRTPGSLSSHDFIMTYALQLVQRFEKMSSNSKYQKLCIRYQKPITILHMTKTEMPTCFNAKKKNGLCKVDTRLTAHGTILQSLLRMIGISEPVHDAYHSLTHENLHKRRQLMTILLPRRLRTSSLPSGGGGRTSRWAERTDLADTDVFLDLKNSNITKLKRKVSSISDLCSRNQLEIDTRLLHWSNRNKHILKKKKKKGQQRCEKLGTNNAAGRRDPVGTGDFGNGPRTYIRPTCVDSSGESVSKPRGFNRQRGRAETKVFTVILQLLAEEALRVVCFFTLTPTYSSVPLGARNVEFRWKKRGWSRPGSGVAFESERGWSQQSMQLKIEGRVGGDFADLARGYRPPRHSIGLYFHHLIDAVRHPGISSQKSHANIKFQFPKSLWLWSSKYAQRPGGSYFGIPGGFDIYLQDFLQEGRFTLLSWPSNLIPACQRTELEASKTGISSSGCGGGGGGTVENTTYEGCRIVDVVNRVGFLSGCIMSKPWSWAKSGPRLVIVVGCLSKFCHVEGIKSKLEKGNTSELLTLAWATFDHNTPDLCVISKGCRIVGVVRVWLKVKMICRREHFAPTSHGEARKGGWGWVPGRGIWSVFIRRNDGVDFDLVFCSSCSLCGWGWPLLCSWKLSCCSGFATRERFSIWKLQSANCEGDLPTAVCLSHTLCLGVAGVRLSRLLAPGTFSHLSPTSSIPSHPINL